MPPFGSEPAERAAPKAFFLKPNVPKAKSRIFAPEPEEGGHGRSLTASASRKRKPFQPEDADDEMEAALGVSHPTLFQPEGAGGTSSDDTEEGGPPEPTVFSLGWRSVETLLAGNFWKEHGDEKASKTKRAYDNSKRKEVAQYKRKQHQGHFKANGVDPERLEKLFALPSCKCDLSLKPTLPWRCFPQTILIRFVYV